jgi:ribonuclease HI
VGPITWEVLPQAPCVPANTGSSGAGGVVVLIHCSGFRGGEHGAGRRKDDTTSPGESGSSPRRRWWSDQG